MSSVLMSVGNSGRGLIFGAGASAVYLDGNGAKNFGGPPFGSVPFR